MIRSTLQIVGLMALGGTVTASAFTLGSIQPPVTLESMTIVEDSAKPGDFVTVRARGIWKEQCPSDLTLMWRDAATGNVLVQSQRQGGIALPDQEPQTYDYRHQVPLTAADGSPLPQRIGFQVLYKHYCNGWFPSSSRSPVAYLMVDQP